MPPTDVTVSTDLVRTVVCGGECGREHPAAVVRQTD
jgi:hypothetical protein